MSQCHFWGHYHFGHYERFKRKNKHLSVFKSIYFLYLFIYFECYKLNINITTEQFMCYQFVHFILVSNFVNIEFGAFKIIKHIYEINTSEHKNIFIFTIKTLIMPNMKMSLQVGLRQFAGPSFELGIHYYLLNHNTYRTRSDL